MNVDQEKLTQFEPLSPKVERSNAVTEFFGKFFTRTQSIEASPSTSDLNVRALANDLDTISEGSATSNKYVVPAITETPAETPPAEQQAASSSAYGRSLSTVTQRISTLLIRNTPSGPSAVVSNDGVLIDYKQSDFRNYWMPDSRGKECYECQEKFTTFRRRHHCRICGQIFCSKCCKQEIPGRLLGCIGNLRLCNYCCRAVAQYLKTPAGEQALTRKGSLEVAGADLSKLRENLSRSFNDSGLSSARKKSTASKFNADSTEQQFLNAFKFESDPWTVADSLPTSKSRDAFNVERQRQSSVCSNGVGSTESELLLNVSTVYCAELPSPLPNETFNEKDSSVFDTSAILDEWEPDWVKNIQAKTYDRGDNSLSASDEKSSLNTDEKTKATCAPFEYPVKQPIKNVFDEDALSQSIQLNADASFTDATTPSKGSVQTSHDYEIIRGLFEKRAEKVLDYLLRRENLDIDRWRNVFWPLVQEIAFTVQPNVKKRKDDMDILRYVHIKTVRCNIDKPNARIYFGTVCTKTVTDNRMKQSFTNPHVLLIGGSVEYERVEGKFCSIDPIIMQETEYMKSVVHKIASRKPDIVLVEKTVSRIAQHYLRKAGISLVCNLKPSVMKRVARCTQTDIVHSIEGQIAKPKLGTCGTIRCESIRVSSSSFNQECKTLLFFDICPPNLGCSIVICGRDSTELQRVKKLMKFMIASLYSSKLEMDLLRMFRLCLLKDDDDDDLERNYENCDVCKSNFKLKPSMNSSNDENLSNDDRRLKFVRRVTDASFYISPFIMVNLPYLETLDGSKCKLRDRFNLEVLYRCGSNDVLPMVEENFEDRSANDGVAVVDHPVVNSSSIAHPFIFDKITKRAESTDMKRMLAKYRAESGRIFRTKRQMQNRRPEIVQSTDSLFDDGVFTHLSVDEEGTDSVLDVLDPCEHQRIAVLYSSYSPTSENAPGFCLKPKVFVMHFYGRFDVTLGDYLERYCFNPLYKCANELCDGYMVSHIRKLVHGNCCVEISIQNVEVSGAEEQTNSNGQSRAILTWDWCSKCKATTSANVVSSEMWHLSFAKFLDYLYNGSYLKSYLVNDTICRCCALHQHVHYFAYKNSVVSFKTSKIKLHGVTFPELLCYILPKPVETSMFMREIKVTSDRTMETFSVASDLIVTLKSALTEQTHKTNPLASSVNELQMILDEAQASFRELTTSAHSILAEFNVDEDLSQRQLVPMSDDDRLHKCNEQIVKSRFCVASLIQKWNSLVNELISWSKRKVDEKSTKSAVEDEKMIAENLSPPQMNASALSTEDTSPQKRSSSTPDVASFLSDRKSLTKVLTTGLLTIPFDVTEHYGLPLGLSQAIVARDTEIASIVAYALSTEDYEKTRRSMLDGWSADGVPITLRMNSADIRSNASKMNSANGGNVAVPQHIELQFADSQTKFYCKIYYAEHFRLLRKMLFPDGEAAFIRSLSRCDQWAPKGGKSGAIFNRTSDKRFILKQMSSFELQSFVKFAPNYFHYLSSVYGENKLTSLAKIFGVFRVGFNNSQTSTAMKMDFIVMEYLFYNRNVNQVYDLKGSLRNRLATQASTTEKHRLPTDDLVLLDENLLQKIWANSFYCYPHAKAALTIAISNDTYFLASNLVMDYSLLCGVDEDKNELIVGIIDYMRTYTWDKRVESWVKSVSYTGQLPTIISPELYRDRFVEVMDTYFPVSPDQWIRLGCSIPE